MKCSMFFFLFFITNKIILSQDNEYYNSTSNYINGVFHLSSNKTFILHPEFGLIINSDNLIEKNFKLSSFSPQSSFAIPLENDNIILICTGNFIEVITSEGINKGNSIALPQGAKNLTKSMCKAVLSNNNLLTIYYPDDIYNNSFLFFNYYFDKDNFNFTYKNTFSIQAEVEPDVPNIDCKYFYNQNYLFCAIINKNNTGQGIIINIFFNEENIINLGSDVYGVSLLELNSDTMIVLQNRFKEIYLDKIQLSNTLIKKTKTLPFKLDYLNYISMAKIDDTNFIIAVIEDINLNIYSISLNLFNEKEIELKPITIEIASKRTPFLLVYASSIKDSLFHIVTNKLENKKYSIYSFIFSFPKCRNYTINGHSNEEFYITLSDLCEMNYDDYSIILIDNNNKNVGNCDIGSDSKTILYKAHDNGVDLLKYKLHSKKNFYSTICTISIKICNEACSKCNEFSNDSYNTKCINCGSTFAKLEENNTICLPKDNKVEYHYLNESAQTFSPCYQTCRYCKGEGTDTNHQCTECKSGYFFSPKNEQNMNCILIQDIID